MKLKICGLKSLQDIEYVNEAEVDYAGFIFAPSPRQVTVELAREMKKALKPSIQAVGVFVGESPEMIRGLVEEGIIDLVQFHGDFEILLPCPTIRAMAIQTQEDILETKCDFVLFDAFKKGVRGSTGGPFDWSLIQDYREKPFFLAGGLNVSNLREAMLINPYCIDLSSGVEVDARKSREKILEVAKICRSY